MPGVLTEYDYCAQVALQNFLVEAYFHPDREHQAALQDVLARVWPAGPVKPHLRFPDLFPVSDDTTLRGAGRHPGRSRLLPKREAVRRVLASLYPDGIPDQATLQNKLLCAAVAPHLPFPVSDDTILRAAGRK